MGAWAPLVPFAKERAQIGEAELGLLLLGLGTGAMCMMPFVARLANRVGCRSTVYLVSAFTAIGLVGLATATSYWMLLAFLLLFGAAIATADVNMNLQGSLVERHHGKQMMSGFHGLFSVGNIFSAGTISLLLWLGLNPVQSIVILALGLGAALLSFGRHMLPFAELEGAPAKRSQPSWCCCWGRCASSLFWLKVQCSIGVPSISLRIGTWSLILRASVTPRFP
ncbi:MFS transporter [Pseudomonas sp. 15A4]|uniref:MFS transporter n=1 Tax=Pseudomonas sp. 15A4 TaxID=2804761 RepID=UPI001F078AC1|nr:MFS transporter [Pseudomonas sp. 15A4]